MKRLCLILLLSAFPVSAQIVSKTMATNIANARIALSNHLWLAMNGGSPIISNATRTAKLTINSNAPTGNAALTVHSSNTSWTVTGIGGATSELQFGGNWSFLTQPTVGGFSLKNGNGDATTPVYAFEDDTETGIYRAANDVIGFTAAGSEQMRIGVGVVGIGTNNPQAALHVHGDAIINGGITVNTFHTEALIILSNRLALADGANHQFDLSLPWKELERTNSMTQGTRFAITNAASTNFYALRIEVEGAASGGSNFAITNTFPSGDLAQLNGSALAVSITGTVTNGTKIEDSWQKTWKRGTNIWVGYRTYNAR